MFGSGKKAYYLFDTKGNLSKGFTEVQKALGPMASEKNKPTKRTSEFPEAGFQRKRKHRRKAKNSR